MALATKSPMDSSSSLGGGGGLGGYGFMRGRSSVFGGGGGVDDEEDDMFNLNLGALEKRIGRQMPKAEELAWDDVDDVLERAGGSGPADDLDIEDDVRVEMIRKNGVDIGKDNMQVDFNGDIVGSQESVGTVVKKEEMEVDVPQSPPVPSVVVKKEEEQVVLDENLSKPDAKEMRILQRPQALSSSSDKKVSLKEKRELESKMFPSELLSSLEGTTSAEVRKMNSTERDLVLFKRKLRNRESARRSRVKRQASLAELQTEVDTIASYVEKILISAIGLKNDNDRLNRQLEVANAELRAWRSVYPEAKPMSQPLKVGG